MITTSTSTDYYPTTSTIGNYTVGTPNYYNTKTITVPRVQQSTVWMPIQGQFTNLSEKIGQLQDTIKQLKKEIKELKEKKEKSNMINTGEFFGSLFGKLGAGMVRLDMNGNLAVKTGPDSAPIYKTYDLENGVLINCDKFVFDVGEEFFFVIPTNDVKPGDIILLMDSKRGKRVPRCVIDVGKAFITVINYEDATVEQVLPERHIFMGNTYFYGKIVSLLNFNGANGKGAGVENILKFKMMTDLMAGANGNGAGLDSGNILSTMMLMNMMTNQNMGFGDMFNFNNIFPGKNPAENRPTEAAKPADPEVITIVPEPVKE